MDLMFLAVELLDQLPANSTLSTGWCASPPGESIAGAIICR
jgi:hypothetical protein